MCIYPGRKGEGGWDWENEKPRRARWDGRTLLTHELEYVVRGVEDRCLGNEYEAAKLDRIK